MQTFVPLEKGDRIGLLGDGQLTLMAADVAEERFGFRPTIYGTDERNCAFRGRTDRIGAIGPYDHVATMLRFAQTGVKVASPDWENVPLGLLQRLRTFGISVFPNAATFATASNRHQEKTYLGRRTETTPWTTVAWDNDLRRDDLCRYLPGILKTVKNGYDGKGQKRVSTADELRAAWHEAGAVPCILEKLVDIDYEISVVVARWQNGTMVHFPPTVNEHREGILRQSTYEEGRIPRDIRKEAVRTTRDIASELGAVGVFTIEYFVTKDGRLLANEMAPRVHNSGHWTMDGCNVSQFELWVRAIAGLPSVRPKVLFRKVVMNNLLTADDISEAKLAAYKKGGGKLHLYGKAPRDGELRKIGHVNYADDPVE
jgi:5-(carboxyamino)imidazole ribonucleotide synthase